MLLGSADKGARKYILREMIAIYKHMNIWPVTLHICQKVKLLQDVWSYYRLSKVCNNELT